ncbi:carboxymuconolactone decarboxylase family protein [Filimonas lacunae]|nr:hypothetical protein [Filimonas lacunae]
MARINPLPEQDAPAPVKAAFEEHRTRYQARITNMKATLAHSLPAFDIYMEWYRLYQRVQEILGPRLAYLFAYSISSGSGCPLCTTFFRKIIIDNGEQPEHIHFNQHEQLLIDFGSQIAQQRGKVEEELFEKISSIYNQEQLVELIAFAGQMIATNVFSNVTETDIDEYLQAYIPSTPK